MSFWDWFEDLFGGQSDPGAGHPTPTGLALSAWESTLPYPVSLYMQGYFSGVFNNFDQMSGERIWAGTDSLEASGSRSGGPEADLLDATIVAHATDLPTDRTLDRPDTDLPTDRILDRLDRGDSLDREDMGRSVSPAGNVLGSPASQQPGPFDDYLWSKPEALPSVRQELSPIEDTVDVPGMPRGIPSWASDLLVNSGQPSRSLNQGVIDEVWVRGVRPERDPANRAGERSVWDEILPTLSSVQEATQLLLENLSYEGTRQLPPVAPALPLLDLRLKLAADHPEITGPIEPVRIDISNYQSQPRADGAIHFTGLWLIVGKRAKEGKHSIVTPELDVYGMIGYSDKHGLYVGGLAEVGIKMGSEAGTVSVTTGGEAGIGTRSENGKNGFRNHTFASFMNFVQLDIENTGLGIAWQPDHSAFRELPDLQNGEFSPFIFFPYENLTVGFGVDVKTRQAGH